jgi:uncharacterized protein (UPF0276 family)
VEDVVGVAAEVAAEAVAAEGVAVAISLLRLGIGWRPELAVAIDRYPGLGFVELLVEDFPPGRLLPEPVLQLRRRGVTLIPHGVSLSLGGAEPPSPTRLARLSELARETGAPFVSEHLAFVRAEGLETGHLLPLARTEEMLKVVVENVRMAQAALPAPLALENIASLVEWPENELDEAEFLSRVLERTGAMLLLDISNLFANSANHGLDLDASLARLPLDRIAYAHVGGGFHRDGFYHDTHTHPVPGSVLSLLEEVSSRCRLPGVMLERDDDFPTLPEIHAELDAIDAALRRGRARRVTA